MLLYFQPAKDADQRRCIVAEPMGQGGDFTELDLSSVSLSSGGEAGITVCVHQSPSVTSIYLVLE